jgi:hypothetical protein
MKRQAMLVVAAFGLCLAVDSPLPGEMPTQENKKVEKAESEYAKVEMKGQLSETGNQPSLEIMGVLFRLDPKNGPKEFQGEGWRKLVGKTVIVTGALRMLSSDLGRIVQVESIRIVDK